LNSPLYLSLLPLYLPTLSSRSQQLNTTKMSMSIEECQAPRPGFPKPVPDTPVNVMEQFSMKGKVIIVTGAAEGIGGAVADAMAEAGGNVALWYNSYVHLPFCAPLLSLPTTEAREPPS
jgi:hypothetical protein